MAVECASVPPSFAEFVPIEVRASIMERNVATAVLVSLSGASGSVRYTRVLVGAVYIFFM